MGPERRSTPVAAAYAPAAPADHGFLEAGFFIRLIPLYYTKFSSIAVLFTNEAFHSAMGTGFDPAKLGLLMTAFLIPYALSAFLLSFTGDLFGPRRALCVAAVLWGSVMLLTGHVASYGA